ncbi:MAG: septation protein A [Undibacterium curvum]|uniref:septation protein A n=1 Tax=Undibacterium curvum TaxID=2762294 RepID=UPI003BE86DF3
MKFLFDVFPVLLFFIAFKWGESNPAMAQEWVQHFLSGFIADGKTPVEVAAVIFATAITLLASVLQISYLLLKRVKVDAMLWVSFITIMVFGGATIYFHSETFIKLKPTVLYWCYGGALLLSQLIFKKNLIKAAMSAQVQLPESVWSRLGLVWIAYFTLMGLANLFVAQQFSTSVWATFKLVSLVGIMPAFIIGQSLFLSKYIEDTEA